MLQFPIEHAYVNEPCKVFCRVGCGDTIHRFRCYSSFRFTICHGNMTIVRYVDGALKLEFCVLPNVSPNHQLSSVELWIQNNGHPSHSLSSVELLIQNSCRCESYCGLYRKYLVIFGNNCFHGKQWTPQPSTFFWEIGNLEHWTPQPPPLLCWMFDSEQEVHWN